MNLKAGFQTQMNLKDLIKKGYSTVFFVPQKKLQNP